MCCPVCNKKNKKVNGKIFCLHCGSVYEVLSNKEVCLIKRKKFDYEALLLAVFFPIATALYSSYKLSIFEMINEHKIVLGLILLFYPLFNLLYLVPRGAYEGGELLFVLYKYFFKQKLHVQDLGRILAFYITFLMNISGVVLILWSIIIDNP